MAQTETVTDYLVTGMTCGHCVASVIEEVSLVPGVSAVTVDLAVGAASTVHVTSATAPARSDIRAAIDEAGYELQTTAGAAA
ncbi:MULTISPECIES: heavy-metal-associated domain-containing protein [Cryobacterium]|uniref:Heavy metal transporter n=1 Tax=Cryobacterium zongtaii TaxID=1259217 RepID=A0A2S3ZE92_9MICO|nr:MULTISPECIES: heavy-metal-associated domain-containing protein [Cryobacterium]POH64821.1 heavy metal transporter [Cryobacterium zongtaii]POH65154.1 heavy metal transporter [Cryobacterium zongtaii]TFC44776.1 copper chaperone [Cryobacterium sp. TMN-39-2]TFC91978.1 copper chaperone [Cryobacterium sp. TMT4-31]